MKHLAAILLVFLISGSASAQGGDFSWTGIWQDVNNPRSFFTIHENGDEVVLIVLVHVDTYGDTLKAAYKGKKGAPFLNKLNPSPQDIFNQVVLEIRSPTEGVVYPYTLANTIVTRLRKVF